MIDRIKKLQKQVMDREQLLKRIEKDQKKTFAKKMQMTEWALKKRFHVFFYILK